jgi:nitroreductase
MNKNLLTTKEAIERRRSIRKFKADIVPDEMINELIDAARLAPSGCNAQPWRFKIVRDQETKTKLANAAYDQAFIKNAPVVIICCADVQGYLNGTISGSQDLGKNGAIEGRIVDILHKKTAQMLADNANEIGARIAANVAIAMEHIVLRALDFGLGTCWVRLLDGKKVNPIFGWDDNIYVVALLPLGFPDEFPEQRARRDIKDIIIE